MNWKSKLSILSTMLLLALCRTLPGRQNVTYTPIPPGFDFPADEATLLQMRNTGNVPAMRQHAWTVFAGLTQPARPNEADSEAIWETWYRGTEVFATGPTLQGLAPRPLKRAFRTPRQFLPLAGEPQLQAAGISLASFTLFNQETKDHVRGNNYQLRATLQALNDNWPSGTPTAQRKIKDFPRAAMSLKTAWWIVKANGTTPMPIWDQHAVISTAPAEPPSTWKRVVVVDPSREQITEGETKTAVLFGRQFPNSRVVPLKNFYHFKLTAEEAQELQTMNTGISGVDPNLSTVQEGDYVALVCLHYTTKEIPEWVWATFWWHDQPEQGPFAADRPDATKLKGPWRNYLMNVSMDMNKPLASDGQPNAVFNPWLEARFRNGANSNCMTCHQRAVWDSNTFLPITRGAAAPDDPVFKDRTSVDFLWSLLLEGNQ
jgi:hypothetical protein